MTKEEVGNEGNGVSHHFFPYGREEWVGGIIKKYGLEQTLRSVGRPKKNGG